jgi:predicted RNA-binding protein with PIN domain
MAERVRPAHASRTPSEDRMSDRLIIVDGYNLILRTPRLRPGPGRTLRESREKLVNLLAWMMGGEHVWHLVVFDGAEGGGRDERNGRIEIRYSRPPLKADDVIRAQVEEQLRRYERVTVVTADLEVARHARAMGADVALSDLFLASALGADREAEGEPEKPATLSRTELEEWAKLFRAPRPGDAED